MQPLFYLFFTAGFMGIVKCKDYCDHLGTLLYEDLGCTPVYEGGGECPVKYACEEFIAANDSCLFRGKRYNVSEEITENLTFENCYAACRCVDPRGEEKYVCAVLDCPEWMGGELQKGCYRKYDIDTCCSTGIGCPDKEKVEECDYGGKDYKDGEVFFPADTCMKCSCARGFEGKIEEPFCRRNLCTTQILHTQELEDYCAPVYLRFSTEKALCCPNDWVCPSAADEFVTVNPKADRSSDLTCKFGSSLLKLGEGFEKKVDFYGTAQNVTCECILPPLLTCKEN